MYCAISFEKSQFQRLRFNFLLSFSSHEMNYIPEHSRVTVSYDNKGIKWIVYSVSYNKSPFISCLSVSLCSSTTGICRLALHILIVADVLALNRHQNISSHQGDPNMIKVLRESLPHITAIKQAVLRRRDREFGTCRFLCWMPVFPRRYYSMCILTAC